LRQLFQLFHGPPPPKLPQGRPNPKPPPQLPQARRCPPAVSAAVEFASSATSDTASRIAASRSDTRSPCADDGCRPAGSGFAATGAAEPSNTAMPIAPGVMSFATISRYFCRSDNISSIIIDRT